MNEKELLKTLEPLISALAAMQKQLNVLEQKPGPKGEDADPEKVAAILVKDYLEFIRGNDGADAEQVDMDALASRLVAEPAFQEACKGEAGIAGESVDIHEVADLIIEKYGDQLKGEVGPMPDISPITVRESLLSNEAFISLTKGADGKDADVHEVAKILATDYGYLLKGEKGADGADVEITLEDVRDTLIESREFIGLIKGADGKDADAEEVAKKLFSFYQQELKGEKGEKGDSGQDADSEYICSTLKKDAEFIQTVKGEQGDPGPTGSNGTGIDVSLWKAGIHREGAIVQHEFGRFYRAVKDTAAEPGKTAEWERIGSGGFAWKGVKSSSEVYEDGDFYIDNGTTFLYLNGKGHMFAKRGRDGKDGERGPQGQSGKDAASIVGMQMELDGVALVLSDGSVLDGEFSGLKKFVKREVESLVDEILQNVRAEEEKSGIPVRVYRGQFQSGGEYKTGDSVTHNGALWLAKKNGDYKEINTSDWFKLPGGI